jgi:excisionase family DNA binding protein
MSRKNKPTGTTDANNAAVVPSTCPVNKPQPSPIAPEDCLLSSQDVCRYLAISKKTLQRLIAAKRIFPLRISGGLYRYRRAAVDLFIQKNTIGGAA